MFNQQYCSVKIPLEKCSTHSKLLFRKDLLILYFFKQEIQHAKSSLDQLAQKDLISLPKLSLLSSLDHLCWVEELTFKDFNSCVKIRLPVSLQHYILHCQEPKLVLNITRETVFCHDELWCSRWIFPHLMMLLKLLDVYRHGVEFTLNYEMVFPVHVPASSNFVFLIDLTSC